MKNANMPAMPFTHKPEYQYQDIGLTKREHFAAMAMQSILSNVVLMDLISKADGETVTSHAVDMADKLLAELEK